MAETADLPSSVPDLTDSLTGVGYLADRGLATASTSGSRLGRPVLLEGEVGVGKTEVAKALAAVLGSAADPAAVLRGHRHQPGPLRVGLRPPDAADPRPVRARSVDDEDAVDQLFGPKFLLERPLARRRPRGRPGGAAHRRGRPCRRRVRGVPARAALRLPDHHPRDRHRSSPNGRRSWCSPPTAPASCTTPSSAAASTTGSATRAPSARSRSCWSASPASARALARKVVAAVNRLRALDLAKPPGVAETIDWVRTLGVLGADDLDPAGRRGHARRGGQGARRPRAGAWRPGRDRLRCLTQRVAGPDARRRSRAGCAPRASPSAPATCSPTARRSSRSTRPTSSTSTGPAARRWSPVATRSRSTTGCSGASSSTRRDDAGGPDAVHASGPRRRRAADAAAARDRSPGEQRDEDGRPGSAWWPPTSAALTGQVVRRVHARGAGRAAPHHAHRSGSPRRGDGTRRTRAAARRTHARPAPHRPRDDAHPRRARPSCCWRRAPAAAAARSILILDVSGSMADYSRSLLQFALLRPAGGHPGRGVLLRHPTHPHHPRAGAPPARRGARRGRPRPSSTGTAAPGSGSRWTRSCATGGGAGRAAARIVVICSDGLDRGDPAVLDQAMERLAPPVPPGRLAQPAQGRRRRVPAEHAGHDGRRPARRPAAVGPRPGAVWKSSPRCCPTWASRLLEGAPCSGAWCVEADGDREVTLEEVVELADAVARHGGIASGIGTPSYGAQHRRRGRLPGAGG